MLESPHPLPCHSSDSKHYLQVKGTAMGTHMAPSYANLFMGFLEQDFLHSAVEKPSLWLRFIDDILSRRNSKCAYQDR